MPSTIDIEFMESIIHNAERCKILIDMRDTMPRGPGKWSQRNVYDILGICIHQVGAPNFTDPVATAHYHVGPNHITDYGMPGIAYDIAIPAVDGPAWLVGDLYDIKWAQGNRSLVGDENRHLLSILVMGKFDAKYFSGKIAPSTHQMRNLDKVVTWIQDMFEIGDEGIFAHSDFGKSSCPGFALEDWIDERRDGCHDLVTDEQWQHALLNWDPDCLPKYGADGDWGNESKKALIRFQRSKDMPVTGIQDPFTELMLLKVLK